jgi:hypothetical protein
MTKRPRMPDELVELFEDKKEHRNQNIGEVMLEEFPELEDELKKRENRKKKETDLDTELFEGGGLLD